MEIIVSILALFLVRMIPHITAQGWLLLISLFIIWLLLHS